MTFDRDKAREVLEGYWTYSDAPEETLDALSKCWTDEPRVFGWADMVDLLRTTYPESIIPQYADEDYGNGPQVVSLLRLITQLREQQLQTLDRDALTALIKQLRVMDEASGFRLADRSVADRILALLTPAPAQTIDRDALLTMLAEALGQHRLDSSVAVGALTDCVLALLRPDPRIEHDELVPKRALLLARASRDWADEKRRTAEAKLAQIEALCSEYASHGDDGNWTQDIREILRGES